MNKKIYIISFIFLGFILNIFFYIISDNYRYFLQSIKWNNQYEVNDNFKIKLNNLVKKNTSSKNTEIEEESIFSWLKNNFWEQKQQKTNNKKEKKKKKYNKYNKRKRKTK
jgi:hypothetical protein